MLICSGCGMPGVMASRTIKNYRDRKMTIMTTTFIPCGVKIPIAALIAGVLFYNADWVDRTAHFIGVGAVAISGIMLKKMKAFVGDTAPFIMEPPVYHAPSAKTCCTWERGWSFVKRAGTVIVVASIFIWFTSGYAGRLRWRKQRRIRLSMQYRFKPPRTRRRCLGRSKTCMRG
jgi:ferrous iron transport protein B